MILLQIISSAIKNKR